MTAIAFTATGEPSEGAPTQDTYRAMALLQSVHAQTAMQCVVIEGEPPSKARVRFTSKGRPYTPQRTVDGEKRIASRLKLVGKFSGNVALVAIFYRSSYQRIDVDNMLKAVLDAGTRAAIWDDDSQVTALLGVVELDRERPRTVIALGAHRTTLLRGEDALRSCEACGTLFDPAGRQRRETARWCSRACRMTLAEPVSCAVCAKPFKRTSGNQVYCSSACQHVGRIRTLKGRTHCRSGHEYTPENTHLLADGRRRCRACQVLNTRSYRANKQTDAA